jgi:nucleoside-diphosphate-sugar epimerase
MPRAVILGGTGPIGRAAARRLATAGWEIEVTGRDAGHMPRDLAAAGVTFHAVDSSDGARVQALLSAGTDLLVDCLCFTATDARRLLPALGDVRSTVMLSSKAVYVDQDGRHANSDIPPRFAGPIHEGHPTVTPASGDHDARAGYGANKVAAELTLLDSGHPVTVVRASKVHGEGANPPREWVFVKRVLDERPAVLLARRGTSIDHTTAASNVAALIELVAHEPGRRILNIADPDAPTVREIAQTVAARLGHDWEEVLLEDDADPALGSTPWDSRGPIVLDTTAAVRLGYVPVGDYATTVADAIDWLASTALRVSTFARSLDPFFARYVDYQAEDCYLTARPRTRR